MFRINGKITTHGTPIPRSTQETEPECIERSIRKWSFADAVDAGEIKSDNYIGKMHLSAASVKELTRERLEKCIAAGMLKKEIAVKFSTTYHVVEGLCSRWKIRRRTNKKTAPPLPAVEEKAAEPIGSDVITEAAACLSSGMMPAESVVDVVSNPSPAELEEFFEDLAAVKEDKPKDKHGDEEAVREILEHLTPAIKDSRERTTFATGAVRDMHQGKGRYDLLPWNAIHDTAVHCERGALQYGERNVDKGIPVHSLIDSALRHLSSYLRGMGNENHLTSAAWNILWAIEMEITRPDMQDIPVRKKPLS